MIKRIFDIIFSTIGIVMLMPAFLIIAILIKMDSTGPVFFIQERMGRDGKVFKLLKFRTMVVENTGCWQSVTSESDKRITSIGRFLRNYRIDEFPQLFNVARGEMSIVGPRPELPIFIQYHHEEYRQVLKIKPGITDPYLATCRNEYENQYLSGEGAEANYVNKILPRKIKVYLEYAEKQSIVFDLKVIFDTLYNTFINKR